ncbi:MAG: ATP-binding protein [Anaerolineales bacterium]
MSNKSYISRLRAWLNRLPIRDPVNYRMGLLVQILLIGFIAIILLATALNIVILKVDIPWQANLLRSFIFILIIGFPLALLRRGHFHASAVILIGIFFLLESFAVSTTDLRPIAETLSFFTLAILLAGLLMGRRALVLTYLLSSGVVIAGALRQADPQLRPDEISVALNFMLLNGLMCLFLDQFGASFRSVLTTARERQNELQSEIRIRKQAEEALKQSTSRLEIMHDIDRALLTARSPSEIATRTLVSIRQLIPCPRASVTLFDIPKREAFFLSADFEGVKNIPDTPLTFEEFGLDTVNGLLQNKTIFINDALASPRATELDRRLAANGIQTWVCLPLFAQGQLIGALNLGRGRGQPFTEEEAAIARDIANQLAIAIQQSNLYKALQSELAEHQKLISQLEANNAELERFTYTVSHDLRNPLVTIKGFLGMLEKDIQDNRQDRIRQDFQRIARAADKMHDLLSDLLELSRVGRIASPPVEVDLVQLAEEAVEMVDASLRARGATVTLSPDLPTVYGDRVRLREVFENLIDNAAKYAGDQEHPLIEIGAREAEETVIFVRDNGIGIEPPYQQKIFGLFEKLNPSSEGTGIGLALIKRIIEVHGGKIWVESKGAGKGSTFCFTIPDSTPNDNTTGALVIPSSSQTLRSPQSKPTD